jgi:hypothetical protein
MYQMEALDEGRWLATEDDDGEPIEFETVEEALAEIEEILATGMWGLRRDHFRVSEIEEV